MTKLSEEIKKADEQERNKIINFVSHIDLRKEYILLVDEVNTVNQVVKTIKAEPKRRGRPSKTNRTTDL